MTTSSNGTTETMFASISDSLKSVADPDSFMALKNRVADAGGETARALRDRIVDVKDVALDRGASLLSSTTRLVKRHPIAAVAIGLGVGYLAFRLIRR